MESGMLHPVVWAPFSWKELLNFTHNLKPEVTSVAVLTDRIVFSHHKDLLHKDRPAEIKLLIHEPGEKGKTWSALGHLLQLMLRAGLDRQSLLLVLGGGALCDVAGLAAALYMRGIRCLYVPTTLLAMVDAALGGKVAVNLGSYKNMVGLFSMPTAVWCDLRFLASLPPSRLLEGLAEMIKHALVADNKHWEDLLQLQAPHDILQKQSLIGASQQIKMRLVAEDPTEKGPRSLLNFGHTVGHALEAYYARMKAPVPHGLCVAAGMLAEIELSVLKAGLDASEASILKKHVKRLFGHFLPSWPAAEKLLPYMKKDKKNLLDTLRFTLLRRTGEGIWNVHVPEKQVLEVLEAVSLKP
jgi:3-dehydroquinate synthase